MNLTVELLKRTGKGSKVPYVLRSSVHVRATSPMHGAWADGGWPQHRAKSVGWAVDSKAARIAWLSGQRTVRSRPAFTPQE